MHTFTGRGGSIYQVGDLFEFTHVPLLDCGDGWDWAAPEDMRCWEGDVQFEVWDGRWDSIVPIDIFPRSGRVSFGRNLAGSHVRASGRCCPTTLIATGEKWRLEVESVVRMASVIGSGDVHTKARKGDAYASIDGIAGLPAGRVFAWLPFLKGVFIGLGRIVSDFGQTKIIFDHEGVSYDPA